MSCYDNISLTGIAFIRIFQSDVLDFEGVVGFFEERFGVAQASMARVSFAVEVFFSVLPLALHATAASALI